MIIDQLPELDSVQGTDEIPVERGTKTYKATLQKIKAFITSLLTKSDVGLENVDNVQQYSAQNPPPYPVTSVNGQTGDVTVTSTSKTGDVLTTIANSTSLSVNSGEITEIASLYLPEGVWLVLGNADWGESGTGYRQIVLSSSEPYTNPSVRNSANTTVAINGKRVYQQIILRSTGFITMKLWGLQNSGSTLAVRPYLCAIALR